jgi:hypothetical protein
LSCRSLRTITLPRTDSPVPDPKRLPQGGLDTAANAASGASPASPCRSRTAPTSCHGVRLRSIAGSHCFNFLAFGTLPLSSSSSLTSADATHASISVDREHLTKLMLWQGGRNTTQAQSHAVLSFTAVGSVLCRVSASCTEEIQCPPLNGGNRVAARGFSRCAPAVTRGGRSSRWHMRQRTTCQNADHHW